MINALLKNIAFTIGTFSRIPMSPVIYKKANTKYTYLLLPFLGLLIGALYYLGIHILQLKIDEPILLAILLIVLNLVITGGIHFDGFLDSVDAFKSYQSKERKLIIIKDARIGAFALIHFTILMGLNICANYYLIKDNHFLYLLIIPCLSRTILLLLIRKMSIAPNDMLAELLDPVFDKYYVLIVFIALFLVLLISPNIITIILVLIALLYALFYQFSLKRHFDHLSGDLCGYYIVTCELLLTLALIFF
jgi:adenosylcobinamide-GDP ribazoletransferase